MDKLGKRLGIAFRPAMLLLLGSYAVYQPSTASKRVPSVDRSSISTIEAGASIGELKLGDTRERALRLFRLRAHVDQKWTDACGDGYNWVDQEHGGNIFVRFRNGRVSQIESTSPYYHTMDGVKAYDSPEDVARRYRNLKAYVLLNLTNSALGDRPLIFWLDRGSGLAFSFAYYPDERRRYLYKIIVFRRDTDLCAEGETTKSPDWKELPPYSLEAPDQSSWLWLDGYGRFGL
jgi:hypothetical protein